MKKSVAIWCSLMMVSTLPAWAGNGNMLHGFGPVNSSMGGAGAGLWVDDPVGALMFNPALISASEGNFVSFGTEFFQDDIEIDVTLNNGATGHTDPDRQLGILPSIGFTRRMRDSKFGFGFGLIGIAGFRTDYQENPSSILFDTPPNGFGRIWTDHRVTKIPVALSYQVNDRLALGLSLNGYIAELGIAPLPYEVFDTVNGNRFYPQGDGLVSSYAWSIQPAFLFKVNPDFTIGGSLTTEQDFDPFEWNSTFANPADPNFGKHRKLEFDLDGPLSATIGGGYRLNEKTSLALDVTWIQYDGVSGFGSPGGIVNRVVQPFGWDNVWAFKLGVQHKATNKLTLLAGYNYGERPLPPENTLTATGAPAYFKHHFSAGLSYKITPTLSANMSGYYVPRSGATGPYENLDNNPLGTIRTTNSLMGGLIGLTWQFDDGDSQPAPRSSQATYSDNATAPTAQASYSGNAPVPVSSTRDSSREQQTDLERENMELRRRLQELEAENEKLRAQKKGLGQVNT